MSSQQAQAQANMTESVIKHYKKQLIYRQNDVPDEVKCDKIDDSADKTEENNNNNNSNNNDVNNGKKVRKKRKNKNCRGQFRHEAMELIKLGSSPAQTLCKSKEPLPRLPEKPPEPAPANEERRAKEFNNNNTVITTNKPILETHLRKPPAYVHALPQMVPERRNSREFAAVPPPEIYRSPPRRPSIPCPPPVYPLPPATYCRPAPPFRPTPTLPPPPYPIARSPPRPVPRPPVRPIAHPVPYSGIHFPFSSYPERRKRRHEETGPPVVAAIDLTVDQNYNKSKQHKCHCECGKTYSNDPLTREVIVTVKDKSDAQVPSGHRDQSELKKANNLGGSKVPGSKVAEGAKPPQLFRIEDLLAKGERIGPMVQKPKEKNGIPTRIVSTKTLEPPVPAPPKPKDYTVRGIMGTPRRGSEDIDTISISSSGSSEPVPSPKPSRPNGIIDKQVPHGKLFYYKNNNSLIRYFDETQKKIFIDNITSGYDKSGPEDKEIIELPRNMAFNPKDNLTVEEYVSEMNLVENFIPRDFFHFYKFVTGYQICNNNLPVSFLTFLKVYNTNGLKLLLERYVSGLKPN